MHRSGFFLVILILAGCLALILFTSDPVTAPTTNGTASGSRQEPPPLADRILAVKNYVRANISTLSPEPEVLGGTFFVTDIKVTQNGGTVWYEDGHNAYVADFTYTSDERGNFEITTFTVQK
jgi:hypothetical protein